MFQLLSILNVQEKYVPPAQLATRKPNLMSAKRFLGKFKWKTRSMTAPDKLLHYNHQKNKAWRERFAAKRSAEGIRLELTLNYDQVWRLKYRGRKRTLHKHSKDAGKRRSRLSGATGRKTKTKSLAKEARRRKNLDQDSDNDASADSLDESSADEATTTAAKKRRREGLEEKDEVFVVPIIQNRMPHTCTTSIWGDGTAGPLTVVFGEGQFSQKLIDDINARYEGQVYVMMSGRDSHFMDTDSTIRMWNKVIGPAIAKRRALLNLSKDDKACLIFDGFRGNDSDQGRERRQLFEKEHNCATDQLEAHSSAHMQPCDAVHAHFRCLCDHYEDVAFGFNDNPLTRQGLEDLLCTEIGYAAKDYTNPDHIVLSSLWAWQHMPKPLMRSAWTSNGFCSLQEMARMHKIDEAQVMLDTECVTGIGHKFEALDCIPRGRNH